MFFCAYIHIAATVKNERTLFFAGVFVVVGAFYLVVYEQTTVCAYEIKNTWIERSEQVVLYYYVAVVTAFELVLAGTVACCYAGFSPLEITVVAIVESVVAYYYVTHTCLFEPIVSVAFEEYCCSGNERGKARYRMRSGNLASFCYQRGNS